MSYNVAIKDRKGNWVHHEVHDDVYIYIRQLEMFIKNPNESRLLDVYKERFPTKQEASGGLG